jgi:hypothetical protein
MCAYDRRTSVRTVVHEYIVHLKLGCERNEAQRYFTPSLNEIFAGGIRRVLLVTAVDRTDGGGVNDISAAPAC